MTNLKMIVSQFDLLAEADVNKNINSMLFPIRKPMLLEAAKAEPNMTIISTLKQLDDVIAQSNYERVHTIDSTALFVFNATEKKDAKDARADATKRLMAMCADGRMPKPRSHAELEKMIALELQRNEDLAAENFSKAVDACEVINSVELNEDYDEAELPEWVTEGIVNKIIDIALNSYKDANRRLEKARFDFQRTGPMAARVGALTLLKHFGIEENEVDEQVAKARIATQELFNKLMKEEEETSLDNPPAETPKEKKKAYRVKKQQAVA